jgi:hypothetical protein
MQLSYVRGFIILILIFHSQKLCCFFSPEGSCVCRVFGQEIQ